MFEIDELEKKWYYYKIKNFLQSAIGVSSVFLLILVGYYLYIKSQQVSVSSAKTSYLTNVLGVSKTNEKFEEKVVETKVLKEKEVVEPVLIAKVVEPKEKEELSLEPIIPVIDMKKEEAIKHTKRTHTKKVHHKRSRPKVKHETKLVKAKANSYVRPKELGKKEPIAVVAQSRVASVVTEPHVTKKMHFQTTRTNYIATMKKKFSKSRNPRDAVLLAKAFYNKGHYQEAEEWALSANKLDSNLDESWLLFAKAKAKQGKDREAIKVLLSYYKKSQSAKAKALIGKIKTGKI